MNQSQVFSYAKNAGLSDEKARIAAAIAMAESGGNPSQVTNDSDDYSFGLWQINMKGSMGPSRRALYGLSKNEDLLDPVINARVMSAISHQGQNFSAWTTYTSGKWKQFQATSVAWVPIPIPGGGFLPVPTSPKDIPGVGAASDAIDAAKVGANAVVAGGKWISNPHNWVRIVYVIGGVILVYAGVESLILPGATKVVGKVMGIVGPGGKVSKVAGAAKNIGQKAAS